MQGGIVNKDAGGLGSKKGIFKAYILSFVAVGVVAFAATADAKWTRTHAFDCKTLGGAPIDTAFALYNNSNVQDMVTLCAVSDTDRFLKQNITRLNVHGWDGHSALRARAMACRSLWSTTGGSCGPMAVSPVGRTHYTLSPNLAVWNPGTTADFGYVWVRVPRKDGAYISSMRGYYTTGF